MWIGRLGRCCQKSSSAQRAASGPVRGEPGEDPAALGAGAALDGAVPVARRGAGRRVVDDHAGAVEARLERLEREVAELRAELVRLASLAG